MICNAGPDHMSSFINDQDVQEKFKSAAMDSVLQVSKLTLTHEILINKIKLEETECQTHSEDPISLHHLHALEKEPLVLFSDNPSDYTADVLYYILLLLMDPEGN